MDYVEDLEQPGQWHSGVGSILGYTPESRRWRVGIGYNYGFNAIRDDDRGGHDVGFLFMYNFGDPKTASDRLFDGLLDVRTPRPRPLR